MPANKRKALEPSLQRRVKARRDSEDIESITSVPSLDSDDNPTNDNEDDSDSRDSEEEVCTNQPHSTISNEGLVRNNRPWGSSVNIIWRIGKGPGYPDKVWKKGNAGYEQAGRQYMG